MLRAILYESEIRQAIGLPDGGTRVVEAVAPLGANEDRCLYFVSKTMTDSVRESLATRRGCIVISPLGTGAVGESGDCIVLETAEPRTAIAKVLKFIADNQRQQPWVTERKISPTSVISPLAVLNERVEIEDGVVIEPFCFVDDDVSIGAGSVLKSGVRVHSRVVIGERSSVGANSVIGHQGFGFVRDESGNKTRITHLGGVVIGSHVEIGALVTVPGGTIGPTIIEDRAKIDDHVHVAHNVRIARSASVTAAAVIAGSAIVAEEAWVGINSSIRDGRRVGSHSLVGMDVSVQQDLADNAVARAPRPDVRIRSDDDSGSLGF